MDYIQKTVEEVKQEFWQRVKEVDPADIMSGTLKVVSDEDIEWLLQQYASLFRKGLGEEKEIPLDYIDNDLPSEFHWNACRTQTLENWKELGI